MDKNLPPEQEEVLETTDAPNDTSPNDKDEEEPTIEPQEIINEDKMGSEIDEEENDVDAMSEENNLVLESSKQVDGEEEIEKEADSDHCNDIADSSSIDLTQEEYIATDSVEPVTCAIPLDPKIVENISSLLVDRTAAMTLCQVEDVGVALSALAVSSYGQEMNQVLDVSLFELISRYC